MKNKPVYQKDKVLSYQGSFSFDHIFSYTKLDEIKIDFEKDGRATENYNDISGDNEVIQTRDPHLIKVSKNRTLIRKIVNLQNKIISKKSISKSKSKKVNSINTLNSMQNTKPLSSVKFVSPYLIYKYNEDRRCNNQREFMKNLSVKTDTIDPSNFFNSAKIELKIPNAKAKSRSSFNVKSSLCTERGNKQVLYWNTRYSEWDHKGSKIPGQAFHDRKVTLIEKPSAFYISQLEETQPKAKLKISKLPLVSKRSIGQTKDSTDRSDRRQTSICISARLKNPKVQSSGRVSLVKLHELNLNTLEKF